MLSRRNSKSKLNQNSKHKHFSIMNANSQRNIPSWAIKSYNRQKKKFFSESNNHAMKMNPPKLKTKKSRSKIYSRQCTPRKKPEPKRNFLKKKPPLLPRRNMRTQQQPKKLLNDRYNVLKEIGKGASATVYLIEDAKTKKQYAAKIFLMSDLALSEKFANLEVLHKIYLQLTFRTKSKI
jgi:hypothetical protein